MRVRWILIGSMFYHTSVEKIVVKVIQTILFLCVSMISYGVDFSILTELYL